MPSAFFKSFRSASAKLRRARYFQSCSHKPDFNRTSLKRKKKCFIFMQNGIQLPEKRDKKLDGMRCSTGRDRNIFDHTGLKPAARTGTDEETVKRKQKRKQATENKLGNRKEKRQQITNKAEKETGNRKQTRKQKRKQTGKQKRKQTRKQKKSNSKRQKKIRKEKRRTTNETHIKTGTFHALS